MIISRENTNAVVFKKFMEQLLVKLADSGEHSKSVAIFFMDGTRIHIASSIQQYYTEKEMRVLLTTTTVQTSMQSKHTSSS